MATALPVAARRRRSVFVIWLLAVPVILLSLGPFLWLLKTSVMPEARIFVRPLEYLPSQVTLENFVMLFERMNFFGYFANSFIVAIGSTVLGLIISMSSSYAFARFRFRGRRFFMTLFLVIPMFPTVLILIPIYDIMRVTGLLNTYASLIVAYSSFTIPFAVWMMTGYFAALPVEMEEAARVDGCSRLGAFVRVLLPTAVPGISATALYIFIVSWNEYTFAAMLAQDEAVRTLPVALQFFITEFTVNWGLLAAGGVIVSLPVILLFIVLQRQLIAGLTAGAVK
ncbi:carbohydrate ABC transporter membrane protein 2 (CUT1 family) [Pseudonocardia hierapolitana]|uniref:Carbohydrate ABC transporter membrane protein 2 (CUT1 family) n=1 Tax=Pseudonocardia hierapolitana TaxID=1128676 RepID=A0A561SZC6_9PSEU|nr:carbohydrate ABC transporter permease [Pseudonocardia hierapolitana]TWF80213.1 carbohydrate ABC transporter membrane protein 2 (CUT1 family) [Pseudonocardia hierapolitana]